MEDIAEKHLGPCKIQTKSKQENKQLGSFFFLSSNLSPFLFFGQIHLKARRQGRPIDAVPNSQSLKTQSRAESLTRHFPVYPHYVL